MKKSLEERIVSFTVEFVKAVAKINENLIIGDDFMRYGKKILYFYEIEDAEMKVADWLSILPLRETEEESVQDFRDNDHCVAYMGCEGYIAAKMYGYFLYRADVYGDGDDDEAEKLYYAALELAYKYGLWFEVSYSDLTFYDDVFTAIDHLLKYEFYNGEKTECPIVVVGPDGRKKTKFRVYAYGELIGQIATGRGKTCLAEDKEYPKYLSEDRFSKDDEVDKNYLQYINEEFIISENIRLANSGIEYKESTVYDKMRYRLQEILDEQMDFYLSSPDSSTYLDLILKAIEKKFMHTGKGLEERRIQTAIVRQHMKKGPEDGWCVIDMEYKVPKNVNPSGKEVKSGIVVFDKNRGFGFIELKYDDKSTTNLHKHYMDVQNVMNNNDVVRIITDELKRKSAYLWAYDLISDTIYKSIESSDFQNLWQGFLFVGGKREKAVSLVNELVKKYGGIVKDENCRFAFYPYEEEGSINKIKLDYPSMQACGSFIKE